MIKITWVILEVSARDGLITHARYKVSAVDGKLTVDTEGNWVFQEPKLLVPFADVTEAMVCEWIKAQAVKDGKSLIETRLIEQLTALKIQQKTVAPWMPQVFTPNLEE